MSTAKRKPDNITIAITYANDVIRGNIESNIYIKLACQRFLDDIANEEKYRLDTDQLDFVVNFIEQFDLTECPQPKKTQLEPFQIFLLANIKALYRRDKNVLKYRTIYIEIPRGNAKTQLISWLSILELLTGTDAQVVYAANTTKQAMEVGFDKIKKLIHQIDPEEKYVKIYYNKIVYGDNKLIITSNESKPIDGLSGSLMCVDEYHEFTNNQTYDVLKSSMVKRTDNQLFVITTAGFNIESNCYKLREYCINVLNSTYNDDSQFVLIYTLDKDDSFEDKKNWVKANPMLNVSVNEDVIAQEVNKAKQSQLEKSGVMVKHFNVWQTSTKVEEWIDNDTIYVSMMSISPEDEMFTNCEVWCGVDLSTVSDISAVSYMMAIDEHFYFFNHYYLPEDTINTSPNREIYHQAIQNQQLKTTPGNVIDYDYILNDILKFNKKLPIQAISYDKWNATQFAINATSEGLYLHPFGQTSGNLNKPLKEFERLIKQGNIKIQTNHLTKWMLSNVVLKTNQMGNYSIDKGNRNKKIDGVAAMVNALGYWLEQPRNANVW